MAFRSPLSRRRLAIMKEGLDQRIVGPDTSRVIRSCQRRIPSILGGGAALSGAYLHHRFSADVDLFFPSRADLREMVRQLPEVAEEIGTGIQVVRDGGTHVRVAFDPTQSAVEMDLVFDPSPLADDPVLLDDGVRVASLLDLRANKLTCVLSRSEPRDLVDLFFLDRAGFPPELDLPQALRKDMGIDPGILAWLVGQFPVTPLPRMLQPLDSAELLAFRDDLANRLRLHTLPNEE